MNVTLDLNTTDHRQAMAGSADTIAIVDKILERIQELPPCALPVKHHFTPGLYVREIFMPKGAKVVSAVHKTAHLFVISKGSVSVWDEKNGVQHLTAPHTGLTTPGTRRVLHITEDCIWLTLHPNPMDETSLMVLEDTLIEPRPRNEKRDEGSAIGIYALPKELNA